MRARVTSLFSIAGLLVTIWPIRVWNIPQSSRAIIDSQTGVAQSGLEECPELGQQKQGKTDGASVIRENRELQAISILQELVDRADQTKNFESQAALVSDALDLLWKHDEQYARSNFLRVLDHFFIRYSPESESPGIEERKTIAAGIRTLITHLAKHDPAAATKSLDRFNRVNEELGQSREKASLRDRLAVAES